MKNKFFYPSHPILDDMVHEFFGNAFGNTKAVSKYPLTNIYTVDNKAYFEIAVAGFSKDEIKIELNEDTLRIVGEKNKEEPKDESVSYIKKDIAKRNFSVAYSMMFPVDKIDAEITDGILKITVIPKAKEKETKLIEIK